MSSIDLDTIEARAATEGVRDDGYRITAPSGEVIVEYKHSEHANAANDGALFGVARANTLTLVHELRRLTAPIAASDLTPEQRAACWQVIDRHKAYLARRGELCTCGSGAHLRECARHPNAYAAHLAELNAQSQADTIAEQDAEIARLTARIADLEALASGPRGDL